MKKIIIVMPAYNAGRKIVSVFERIPREIRQREIRIIIVNDGSTDDTAQKINEIKKQWCEKILCISKAVNEGYARAQKDGFTLALKLGADIVVLLHSDGQYAPEILPELLAPLESGEADIIQGSRMLKKQDALKGGMPIYKFIANICLSAFQNWVYGLKFAEYHSGYMLYSRHVLESIPFQKLSNTFHFDGEMLLVGAKIGLRIKEIPIPTYYGDEVSHANPIFYGLQVLGTVAKYVLGKYNF